MSSTVKKGREGEAIAAEYVQQLGYKLLAMNYVYSHCEIDIVALDGKTLVFIEVKTRNNEEFGSGAAAITEKKRAQIKRAATGYFIENSLSDTECRFDGIVVTYPYAKDQKIEHYKSIIEY